VLCVEDNPSNLVLIERILRRLPGVRLMTTMQARLGIELARQHRPDVILLDLHLPDMGGEAALGALVADPSTAGIPVVILSADATPHRSDRLRAAGAAEYLTKPFDVNRFLEVVEGFLPET
jgi:CheY-like chemotaxis protein